VSASEANRNFSELLRAAARGERITITSRNQPVAELGPLSKTREERERAKQRLMDHLHRQVPTGEPRTWTREELYDD
jgi:prevent-host-death family protein